MSGGRITRGDLDNQFTQLVNKIELLHHDLAVDEWNLAGPSGEDGTDDTPRTPWVIENGSVHPVVFLGYTRREAMSALVSMNAIVQVLL